MTLRRGASAGKSWGWPRTNAGAALAAAAFCALLSPLQASAQTYTAKVLSLAKSTSCDWKIVRLSENGDVAAGCELQRTLTLSDWLALLTSGSGGQTTNSVIDVWRANGTTQVLTGGTAKNANAYMTAILANGNVIGSSQPLGLAQWKGTVRSIWVAPASLGAGGWQMVDVSPSGNAILLQDTLVTPPRYATLVNGVSKELAAVPAPCGDNAYRTGRISETGLVGLVANAVAPDPDAPSELIFDGKACLWSGSAWVVAASLPLNNPGPVLVDGHTYNRGRYVLDGVTRTGQMLIEADVAYRSGQMQSGMAWLWSSGTNFQPFDTTVQAVAGNDDLIGGTDLNWNTSTASATVWRNGVALDLNSRTTVPTGLKLLTVVSGNKKGQLLVLGAPPDHSKWPSLLLLTPK
jgi:hypothetical protein